MAVSFHPFTARGTAILCMVSSPIRRSSLEVRAIDVVSLGRALCHTASMKRIKPLEMSCKAVQIQRSRSEGVRLRLQLFKSRVTCRVLVGLSLDPSERLTSAFKLL